jgi:hypothetical protein
MPNRPLHCCQRRQSPTLYGNQHAFSEHHGMKNFAAADSLTHKILKSYFSVIVPMESRFGPFLCKSQLENLREIGLVSTKLLELFRWLQAVSVSVILA